MAGGPQAGDAPDAEHIVSFVASHRCMTAARHLLLLLAGTGAFVAPGSFAARRPMKKTVSAGGVAPPPSAKEKLLWSPGVLKQTAASFAVLWLAKQWALSDPRALWRHVDLSYGWARPSDAIVRRYCTNGDWSKLTHLSLADCGVLTDAALRALHQHCPELVSLDVSGTSKLTLGAMKPLGERLTELRLDRVSAKSMGGTNQLIVGMLTERLATLSVADVTGLDRGFIRNLHKRCGPALRRLNLSHSGVHHQNLPWLELQRSCPNVEELEVRLF